MKPARIILLVVAILAGGLAAFLATRGGAPQVQQIADTIEIRQEPRSQVLIASRPIGLGQRITPGDVTWQDWPEGAVRPEYITANAVPDAPNQLAGTVARFEIFTGEPIREAKLVSSDQGYMSAVITQGMRAVSVGVTAESASGGYIVPNDRVDVVLTRSSAGVSETILANVRVLAIGNRLGETGATGSDSNNSENPRSQVFESSQIATLELTPAQAETILNASSSGRLALVLRSVVDFGETAMAAAGRSQAVQLIRYGQQDSVMAGTVAPDDPALTGEAALPALPALPPALPNVPAQAAATPPPATPLEAASPLPQQAPQSTTEVEP